VPTNLFIKQGRIIDPSQDIDLLGNMVVTDGKIVEITAGTTKTSVTDHQVINAHGAIVCPGFIDMHCHLREPGFEDKETIATGTSAAARGGFTTVCCMPNTNPPLDTRAAIEHVKKKAESDSRIRVLPIGCITKGRAGREIVEMNELAEAGVVGFSDDGNPVASSRVMFLAMQYSKSSGLPIIDHCEDRELSEGTAMNEGAVSIRLGLKGVPNAAEEVMVARDIALAYSTGAILHIAHVSTERSVELIRQAKKQGIRVTAEVTPHHLLLTDQEIIGNNPVNNKILAYNTNAKVNPPLRTARDISALLGGLRDGTIDAIATDHAPHTLVDKICEFDIAASGISNLETALGCLLKLVNEGLLDLKTLISTLTFKPAGIIKSGYKDLGTLKIGAMADITIIDPEKEWTVDSSSFLSKGKNTPFESWKLKGKVITTIANGKIVYRDDIS
jgi:dihydroorotase